MKIYFIDCNWFKNIISDKPYIVVKEQKIYCSFYEITEKVSWSAADIVVIGDHTTNLSDFNPYDDQAQHDYNALKSHFQNELGIAISIKNKLIINFGFSFITEILDIGQKEKYEPFVNINSQVPEPLKKFCDNFKECFFCNNLFNTLEFKLSDGFSDDITWSNIDTILFSNYPGSKLSNYGFYVLNFICLPKIDCNFLINNNQGENFIKHVIDIHGVLIKKNSKNKNEINRPDWVNHYKLPELIQIENEMQSVQGQIKILQEQESQLYEKQTQQQELECLLYTKDNYLEESIVLFLQLFQCHDVIINKRFEPDIEIDLLFTIDNIRFVAEVKGKVYKKNGKNIINSEDVLQLSKNYNFYSEQKESKQYKGITPVMFCNISIDVDPKERLPNIIHANAIKHFKPIVIKTEDLYNFVIELQKIQNKDEEYSYKQNILHKLFMSEL